MTSHPDFEDGLVPEGRCRRGVFVWFACARTHAKRGLRRPTCSCDTKASVAVTISTRAPRPPAPCSSSLATNPSIIAVAQLAMPVA